MNVIYFGSTQTIHLLMGKTIHALNIVNTDVNKGVISFNIIDKSKFSTKKTKTKSRRVHWNANSRSPCMQLCAFLNEPRAILRVSLVRRGTPEPRQLLLSWKTKCPVTKRTLSSWITTILCVANIDLALSIPLLHWRRPFGCSWGRWYPPTNSGCWRLGQCQHFC